MVTVIADCPQHGTFEDGRNSDMLGPKAALLNSKTTCPACRALSPIRDGVYQIQPDGTTRAELWPPPGHPDRILVVSTWARNYYDELDRTYGLDSPEVARTAQILEAEAQRVPWARRALKAIGSKESVGLAAWIGIAATVILQLYAMNAAAPASDVPESVIVHVVEEVRNQEATPAAPEQPKPSSSFRRSAPGAQFPGPPTSIPRG